MTAQPNDFPTGHRSDGPHTAHARGEQDAAAANRPSTPIGPPLLRVVPPTDHAEHDAHLVVVGGDTLPAVEATPRMTPIRPSPRLLDPLLSLASDVLTDLETVRVANENRLRQLTRTETDSDGEERGFGLDGSHPDVARLAAIVDLLAKAEHDATLQLQRQMRRHPLGPWVKATVGIGEKQGARLLAAVGDPYWNTLHDRPRTVSELWAYCGLHTRPVGYAASDAQVCVADGGESAGSNPGHTRRDTHRPIAWVAARRQKGQKANWSATAKMRAWNIAGSCIKQAASPYRAAYDTRRTATTDRVHAAPCIRCGPSGHPAPVSSPWSKAHQHADALRIVSKAILRDLWVESRRIYEDAE